MQASIAARNSLSSPVRALPSRTTPLADASKGVVPFVPTEFTQALDECLEAGRYGSYPVESSCAGSGFRARVDRAEVRGESEFVCLADGVWLISAGLHVDANLLAWARHDRTLCFTVVLGGGIHSGAADRGSRFCLAAGYAAVCASGADSVGYVQYFTGMTTEAVSIAFRNERALTNFGLDPKTIRDYLQAPDSRIGDHSLAAFCEPQRAAIESAWAIRNAAYEGALRRIYLTGKSLELISHLLASRVLARSAAESQALMAANPLGLAAVARAALANTERQPTAGEIARRLGIAEARLLHAFKMSYGISLHEHAAAARMSRARDLLRGSRLPIIEIALACGYQHHCSFSTAYTRAFGETPLQTRRSALRPA